MKPPKGSMRHLVETLRVISNAMHCSMEDAADGLEALLLKTMDDQQCEDWLQNLKADLDRNLDDK